MSHLLPISRSQSTPDSEFARMDVGTERSSTTTEVAGRKARCVKPAFVCSCEPQRCKNQANTGGWVSCCVQTQIDCKHSPAPCMPTSTSVFTISRSCSVIDSASSCSRTTLTGLRPMDGCAFSVLSAWAFKAGKSYSYVCEFG